MRHSRAILAIGLIVCPVGLAQADDAPACAEFSWFVARERTAFAAPDLLALESGSALPDSTGALRLKLKPASDVTLPVPSEKAMKPGTFSGFVTATVPATGTYQVTLSDEGWVDVSQDGRTTLKATAHSGKVGCPGIRKSLRFALTPGTVTIEISRAPGPQITLGLLKAK
ncbi:hypothetical protein [Methylobacterium fujisawaense]|uniref:hypothetical protein n=1 Tax=Methylobacterium fujisawaense TaxID=107400 RepID=UPI0036F6594D